MDPLTLLATIGGGIGGGLIKAGGSRALGAAAGAIGSGLAVHDADKSRNKQTVTMDLYHKHQDILNPTIEQYGDGDIGYSIGALRVAASKKIIKPDMSVKEVAEIMKRENLAPYGFKLDESILNEVFNPFTKDLPQGDTMNVGDFG